MLSFAVSSFSSLKMLSRTHKGLNSELVGARAHLIRVGSSLQVSLLLLLSPQYHYF